MSLAIRELGVPDQILVEELLDTFEPDWNDALAPTASGAIAFLTDSNAFMFGAYEGSTETGRDPVGWLWGMHARRPDGRVMTYVHQLEVHEDHRRRGIASLLMEQAIGAARQRKAHKLWLVTRQGNEASNPLYQSLGADFEPDGSQLYTWNLS